MSVTELSERKLAVLSAIVKNYIETGEPVGSKILTVLIENSPSSATLRNEMNALCNLGLLSQPHTSAGRIPTSKAYRLYINTLMEPRDIKSYTKDYINTQFLNASSDAESMPKTAADTLSNLTGYPAISTCVVGDDIFVKQAKLLPVSRKTAVLLLVFSDGRAKNSICHIPSGLTADMTTQFSQIVSNYINGKNLSDFTKAYLQSVIASAGINALSLTPLLTCLFSIAESASQSSVQLSGAATLHNFCNDEETQKIISLANRTTPFLDILKPDDETSVIFGNDTPYPELQGKVIVACSCYCKNRYYGKIGIIGPDRMSYEQIIPSVEYISKKLTAQITDAVNDMED